MTNYPACKMLMAETEKMEARSVDRLLDNSKSALSKVYFLISQTKPASISRCIGYARVVAHSIKS